MTDDIADDFMQYMMNLINEGYSEYKKNHPDFARVAQQQEGKTDEEFERQFTHCQNCGEWLEGFDTCPECGRINTNG